MSEQPVRLRGLIKIEATLECLTGLRIGSGGAAAEIGGVENVVVKDPISQEPYIPGSSLKGAMRSHYELYTGKQLSTKLKTRMHICGSEDCDVCTVFGRTPDYLGDLSQTNFVSLTRLRVDDAYANEETREKWNRFGSVEVKYENSIDRLTSESNPRSVERIPRGSEFEVRMTYRIFDGARDLNYLKAVFQSMKLVEEDYLGGYGSRGYGRIRFKAIKIKCLKPEYFEEPHNDANILIYHKQYDSLEDLIREFEQIKEILKQHLELNGT